MMLILDAISAHVAWIDSGFLPAALIVIVVVIVVGMLVRRKKK